MSLEDAPGERADRWLVLHQQHHFRSHERRDWLAALGLVVEVQPAGVVPRYRLSLGIPLPDGGERRIVFDGGSRVIVVSGGTTT